MPLFGIAMCLIFGWSRRANAVIPDNITGAKRQCLLLVWRYIGPICIGIILVHGLIGCNKKRASYLRSSLTNYPRCLDT